MATVTFPPPPRSTANPAPPRPADSVRRTSSIDVSWPDGFNGDRLFVGRGRDLVTPQDGGAGRTLAEAEMRATLTTDRTITAISATPTPARLQEIVGQRGGNHLRILLQDVMPELLAETAPLYLVLDDISGTSLVSAFAWSQWQDDWATRLRDTMAPEQFERLMTERTNVCWGLQEGNSGLNPEGPARNVADADAGDLRNPADPEGWHELPEFDGPGFRRARRIDVVRDDAAGVIRVDAAFQDSAARQNGGRVAIHEYNIAATVDIATLELLSLDPEPRILPFSECPGAVHNTQRLVGSRLDVIRQTVLAELRGPAGCTHLNDALRALAEVPKLASYLERASASS